MLRATPPDPAPRRRVRGLGAARRATAEEATVEQTRDPGTNRGSLSPSVEGIEKGWTVYDALGRPLGNVTDVDTDRGRLGIDGRSAGFDEFEVPLTAVREAGDNDVHLAPAVDPDSIAGRTPRFIDAPRDEPIPARPRMEPAHAARPTAAAAGPTPRPVAAERGGPAPVWTEGEEAGGPGRWRPYLGLAAAGLGAAGYAWWRRRRKQTSWDR